MKLNKTYIVLIIIATLVSCNSNTTDSNESSMSTNALQKTAYKVDSEQIENKENNNVSDTLQDSTDEVVYDDRRNNLELTLTDTIKTHKLYFFSNPEVKDSFLLIVEPGMIKNSKAELRIITADHREIYNQCFDSFYFMRGIYEPDTIPIGGGQDAYKKYKENYWKSLTLKQYETYLKNSIESFYENIYPIGEDKYEVIKAWEEDIRNKEFLNEVLTDSTINLIDITCFDQDEGGAIIGFSRKLDTVATLLEHD